MTDSAKSAFIKKLFEMTHRGHESCPHGFHEEKSLLPSLFHHFGSLAVILCKSLLAYDMLAVFKAHHGLFIVQAVRRRNIYEIYLGACRQFLIAAEIPLCAVLLGLTLCPYLITRRNGI